MIDIEKEFDDFFDFETEDKSIVTSESCKLFAKHCLEMANLREQAEAPKAKVAEHNYKRAVWVSLEIAIQHAKVADDPFEFLVNQIQAMHNTEFSVNRK